MMGVVLVLNGFFLALERLGVRVGAGWVLSDTGAVSRRNATAGAG